MQPIAAQVDERVAPFHLPQPLKPLASPLMRFEEVSIGYAADTPVLQGLNLRIDQDDRIALLGQNGNGKSTFAKLHRRQAGAAVGQRVRRQARRRRLFRPAPARRAQSAGDAVRPHAAS